jgi:hypothetical protein
VKRLVSLSILSTLFLFSYQPFAFSGEVRIGVRVILASHKGTGVDASLQDIEKKLVDQLKYSSYRLLQEGSFLLAEGQTDQLPVTQKKELRIRFVQERRGSVEIDVEILKEGKEIFKSTNHIPLKGVPLVITVPRHEEEDERLFLAISAQGP